MIQTELKLVSDKCTVSGVFPQTGILYQCVDVQGIALCSEPCGTVMSAFIRVGRRILMAGLVSEGGSGVSVRSLVKGQTVSVGLCTYHVNLSRRIVWPNRHVMVVLGAVCAALVAGVVMPRLFGVERSGEGLVQPIAVKSKKFVEERIEVERLDLLLKHDEGIGNVQVHKNIRKKGLSSDAGSREAFQLYEQGLSLLDAGKYVEAESKLAEAKDVAGKLPIAPAYASMIDEAIERARTAISEQRAEAVAQVRKIISEAGTASPSGALKIIAKARAKMSGMKVSADDGLLRDAHEELEKLHRSSIFTLLARAHTLERLEGCRAAEGAYRETLKTYGSDDKLLVQEIESALNRCGGGGRK